MKICVSGLWHLGSLLQCGSLLVVLDANRFLPNLATAAGPLMYFAVGMPNKEP